jgi:hypothetical protein
VPCEYSQVYIGQTGCSVKTRIKEHQRHIHLEQPDKSAMANTASAWATALSYRTPPSSPPRWRTWTRWLRRPSRLSSTQRTWWGKVVFVSAGHGNHSSTLEDVGRIRCSIISHSWALGQWLSFPGEPQPVPGSYSLLLAIHHLSHFFLHMALSSPWWWRQFRSLKRW